MISFHPGSLLPVIMTVWKAKVLFTMWVLNVGKPLQQAEQAHPEGAAFMTAVRGHILLSKQERTTAATSVGWEKMRLPIKLPETAQFTDKKRFSLGYQGEYHSENKTVQAETMSKLFPDTRRHPQAVWLLPRIHCNSRYVPCCRPGRPVATAPFRIWPF